MKVGRLELGGHIDRYVGSLFIASYATAFLLVVGLVVILDLASNLDYFEPWSDGRRAPAVLILRYYLLTIPFLYLQVAPFVTVVAGSFTVSRLMKHNEILAGLASGVSSHRVLLTVFLGGLCACLGMLVLREAASSSIGAHRDALLDVLENQRTERVFENVWIRDVTGQVAHLEAFYPTHGEDPAVARFEGLQATVQSDGVWQSITADEGIYVRMPDTPGAVGETGWKLTNGLVVKVGRERLTPAPIDYLTNIHFTPEDVLVTHKAHRRPLELSLQQVTELARRDPDNRQYQTLFQYNLTFPIANLVLLFVVLPFMLGHERGRGVEGLALGGVLCLFYFATDFVARTWGMEGSLSPLLASWLPILFFGSVGAVIFDSMNT